ncbi:MAG: flavodoxin domain-containing protein [Bacillota bacterium]|nr:flavodoxin domain-containing protein [Bacillota bacterium]MDW7684177.1 flavodoxin domain-containing protein [Bacillota bacterium]
MMYTEIKNDIYWVGALDWNIRYFHGPMYTTHRGTTYNAYLILDEEPTLVDTVYTPFGDELLENIRSLIDPQKLKYVVVNHVEMDHSGALPKVMEAAPQATILCSEKAAPAIEKHFNGSWNMQVVKTGDTVSIGKRTLAFVEAPMLHWPDSMFTYIPEEKLLLPNDAFGQHIATSSRFDDEVDMTEVMQEAKKYYANILLPFSPLVLKKINEVVEMGIEIDMIAPSHGIIWRKDPARIINTYVDWAKGTSRKKATIVYDTMWGSTDKMARAISDGLTDGGMEVKMYRMSVSDRNDVIAEVMDSELVVTGSPTINRDFLPALSAFLDDLTGLKPKKKRAAMFGSSGWSRGATAKMSTRLKEAGFSLVDETMEVYWVPGTDELEKCREFGRRLAAGYVG